MGVIDSICVEYSQLCTEMRKKNIYRASGSGVQNECNRHGSFQSSVKINFFKNS